MMKRDGPRQGWLEWKWRKGNATPEYQETTITTLPVANADIAKKTTRRKWWSTLFGSKRSPNHPHQQQSNISDITRNGTSGKAGMLERKSRVQSKKSTMSVRRIFSMSVLGSKSHPVFTATLDLPVNPAITASKVSSINVPETMNLSQELHLILPIPAESDDSLKFEDENSIDELSFDQEDTQPLSSQAVPPHQTLRRVFSEPTSTLIQERLWAFSEQPTRLLVGGLVGHDETWDEDFGFECDHNVTDSASKPSKLNEQLPGLTVPDQIQMYQAKYAQDSKNIRRFASEIKELKRLHQGIEKILKQGGGDPVLAPPQYSDLADCLKRAAVLLDLAEFSECPEISDEGLKEEGKLSEDHVRVLNDMIAEQAQELAPHTDLALSGHPTLTFHSALLPLLLAQVVSLRQRMDPFLSPLGPSSSLEMASNEHKKVQEIFPSTLSKNSSCESFFIPAEDADVGTLSSAIQEGDPTLLHTLLHTPSLRDKILSWLLTTNYENSDSAFGFDEEDVADAQALLGASVRHLNAIQLSVLLGYEQMALEILEFVDEISEELESKKVLFEFLGRLWGNGNTTLHLASFFGMSLLVHRMLSLGVPRNRLNDQKYKAVDCCADDDTRMAFTTISEHEMRSTSAPNLSIGNSLSTHERSFESPPYDPLPMKDDCISTLKISPERTLLLSSGSTLVDECIPQEQELPSTSIHHSTPVYKTTSNHANKVSKKVQFSNDIELLYLCRFGDDEDPIRLPKLRECLGIPFDMDLTQIHKPINLALDVNEIRSPGHGMNALHIACSYGHLYIVTLLLSTRSCRVNEVDEEGWSALHMACAEGHVDIVKTLLCCVDICQVSEESRHSKHVMYFPPDGRIHVHALNGDGEMAIDLALQDGREEIFSLLREYSPPPEHCTIVTIQEQEKLSDAISGHLSDQGGRLSKKKSCLKEHQALGHCQLVKERHVNSSTSEDEWFLANETVMPSNNDVGECTTVSLSTPNTTFVTPCASPTPLNAICQVSNRRDSRYEDEHVKERAWIKSEATSFRSLPLTVQPLGMVASKSASPPPPHHPIPMGVKHLHSPGNSRKKRSAHSTLSSDDPLVANRRSDALSGRVSLDSTDNLNDTKQDKSTEAEETEERKWSVRERIAQWQLRR